jgi:cysteinyl-tRNA synthetase
MRLYNTMTGKKEEFVPIEKGKVRMYSCGPTVYNYFHIGNARPFIIFDALRRYLEYRNFEVIFVQNFTDIDDKMIKRANEEGIKVSELAERYIGEYYRDARALGIRDATYAPKATENIGQMIELIEKLFEKGYAYISDGDVYFSTRKFEGYGKLSHRNIDDLEAGGARVAVGEKKKDPLDFALWKSQKPGEPAWKSPWGMGRPGWHIECSVMAKRYLGETIDIHSGGQDLIFPHHENEIAQSEAANGRVFARYWLHNGFLNVNNEKMSKSLGNFFTVRDIARHFDYEVIRFFMLSAHYRSPINFSDEMLEQSKNGLERMYKCLENLQYLKKTSVKDGTDIDNEEKLIEKLNELKEKFIMSMDDDMNTADAIAAMFEMVREINAFTGSKASVSKKTIDYCIDMLNEHGNVLGLLQNKNKNTIDSEVEELIKNRKQARNNKDWKTADEIRDKLKEMGIVLEDTPQGTKWTRI